jgi:hypothetical protein
MKKWLRAQPNQPATIADLQTLLDTFVTEYNQRRPHRSLPRQATPATAYQTRPKATPDADRTGDHHDRVRHDRVDDTGVVTLRINGRLHHIGIGRTHARTHIILLIHDLHVRIVDAATGQLYRELLIDPTGTTSPPEIHPDQPDHQNDQRPNTEIVGSAVSYVLRHHNLG